MYFYGFQFTDTQTTTIKDLNKNTKDICITGEIFAFNSRIERDQWIELAPCRVKTTKAEAQFKYFRGTTPDDYNMILMFAQEKCLNQPAKYLGGDSSSVASVA